MSTLIHVSDVSERERLFRTVFDNSPDAIFIEDMGGYVLDVNPSACLLHGLTRDQLIGKNVRELVPPENRASMVRPERLVNEEVEGYSLSADGRRIPVAIRSCAIPYMGTTAIL